MKDTNILNQDEKQLIADYIAGKNVNQQLLQACKANPEVKKVLAAQVRVDRLLEAQLTPQVEHFSQKVVQNLQAKMNTKPSNVKQIAQPKTKANSAKSWLKSHYLIAASILVFISIFYVGHFTLSGQNLAVVTKVAAMTSGSRVLTLGESIGRGQLDLDKGFSEILLKNGVVLVLEAPVKLNIRSANLVILNQGKLVARVPEQAIGFRVDTPSSEIVDLGTEFAVDVNATGESQVHVLEGEIKARGSKEQGFKYLQKDQAMAFGLNKKEAMIQSNPHLFMRALPGKSALNPEFLHWRFDQIDADGYKSYGTGINGQHYQAKDKTVEKSIEQTQGVFGQAVTFDGKTNWLQTEFPGIGGDNPRTVAFWVKVPQQFSLNEAFGIVSWGAQTDYAAWQISPNPLAQNGGIGRVRVGTYNAQVVGSTDLRDGQWHHVAVVLYGGEASDISTHVLIYVDGELEATHSKSIAKVNTKLTHQISKPLSLGRNIGYIPSDTKETQKFFRGSVDELFVFNAALEQAQIQNLMQFNQLTK